MYCDLLYLVVIHLRTEEKKAQYMCTTSTTNGTAIFIPIAFENEKQAQSTRTIQNLMPPIADLIIIPHTIDQIPPTPSLQICDRAFIFSFSSLRGPVRCRTL